jgi:hypothetical protein
MQFYSGPLMHLLSGVDNRLICFESSGASQRASLRREAERTDAAGRSEVILISPQCGLAA